MANTRIEQVTNERRIPGYIVEKDVTTTPKTESKATSLSMPTDPAMLAEIQRQAQAAARANGVDPNTGKATPFEVVGFKPDDERKRREAERVLNDRKRKENAWYNAIAVLGDSLTAALGGNVWQRQPNNIGAKAKADNERLLAEQKAEDQYVQARMNNASAKYADTVNKLIQNYLTKTVTTNTTGGDRHEKTTHPERTETRQVAFALGDNNGTSGSSGGKGSGSWKSNGTYQIGLRGKDGKVQYHDINGQDAKNIVEHAKTIYTKALQDPKTHDAVMDLLGPEIVTEKTYGSYDWNDEGLLRSGFIFDSNGFTHKIDESIRDLYRRITGDNTDYTPVWDMVTPAERAIQAAQNNRPAPRSTGATGRAKTANATDRNGRRGGK